MSLLSLYTHNYTRDKLTIYQLPNQLLTSQNLEPVTYEAMKIQLFGKFRNSQVPVNPVALEVGRGRGLWRWRLGNANCAHSTRKTTKSYDCTFTPLRDDMHVGIPT